MNISAEKPPSSSQFSLLDAWALLREAKVLIAITTLVAAAIAAAIAWTLTPTFRADVVVTEVAQAGLSGGGLSGQIRGLAGLAGINIGGAAQGSGADRRAILRSRMLIEEFIRRKKLLPDLERVMSGRKTMWWGVKGFYDKVLNVREDARTNLITLTIEWTDPASAAQWANEFVALANDIVRQRDATTAERNIEFVNRQIDKTTVIELRKVLYEIIEQETKTLMLANSRQDYAFAVVDPAVPPELKASPARALILILGGFFGFVVGVLVAIVRRIVRTSRAAAAAH